MKFKAIILGFISYLSIAASYADNASLDQLRNRFSQWQTSYQSLSDSDQKKLLDSLQSYPLYPYAKYQYLQAHLDTLTSDQINQFIAENQNFPLSTTLMQNYLQALTIRQDWNSITQLNIDNSIASQCRYQYALFQQGKKTLALEPIKEIWLSASDLPAACDPIFAEWSKTSDKTANTVLTRIDLTLKRNNVKLARHLTDQLPDNYKTLKKNLIALYNSPKTLPDFARNISPSPFSQKVVMQSFARFASIDTDKAKSLIPTLVKQQKLSKDDENAMFRTIASNYFQDSATDEQIKWRDQFIAQDRSTSLVERRIRQALRKNDINDLAYWLNLLNQQDKQKDEWQYWQAIVLLNNKQEQEANTIFNTLIEGRGFYAIYSAQKLNKPYHFDLNYPVMKGEASKQKELTILRDKYKNDPVMKRIDELHFWQMRAEAAKEWRNYLYNTPHNKQYAELARYSHSMGWGEHSIQATIAGKLWDNWVERFPIVYQDLFNESLTEKTIPLSFALSIARQESALDATVQSPAGARGLMQLMPGTAKDSAKKITNLDYTSAEQLYDPKTNIQLGTYYLNYVYQLFNNNRILASAAYNAGPNRVNRWLKDTSGKLDAIAFIESIPFTETRNYVKSVLVYDYIYALLLNNQHDTILHDNEINNAY
ncbi:soluble lytic murein transglycosylase [Orbus hercynius]|uniref:Soluble lytic murein transglycosylase n=1 Tax=Orbus hercynius TaxID=593135 RepID=A0A495RF39_9GAMM|nr:murein transglycosylase [Orbus hercynius]RKS85864.1 soluble lytic murein transglycosylase [Orbus hercynius]